MEKEGTKTHLVWRLEVPGEPGKVQEELCIGKEGSLALSIKASSPTHFLLVHALRPEQSQQDWHLWCRIPRRRIRPRLMSASRPRPTLVRNRSNSTAFRVAMLGSLQR